MTLAIAVSQIRAPGLGASEAPAALGVDQYRSPLDVCLSLRGESRPTPESESMFWGKVIEPLVRGLYARRTGCPVIVPTASLTARHPHSFIRATPDGFVHPEGVSAVSEADPAFARLGADGLVEVKTTTAYKADDWAQWIPAKVEIQARVQLAVTDLPWCDAVALVGGQHFAGPFRVHRDARLEENILRALTEFWELVQSGGLPDVDASEGWRRYVNARMVDDDPPIVLNAGDDLKEAVFQLQQAKRMKKQADAEGDEATNRILLALSAARATVVDAGGELGRVIAYRSGAGFDHAGYAIELEKKLIDAGIEHESIRERWRRPHTGWSLRAPRSWSK